jgi:hypothetical protein
MKSILQVFLVEGQEPCQKAAFSQLEPRVCEGRRNRFSCAVVRAISSYTDAARGVSKAAQGIPLKRL